MEIKSLLLILGLNLIIFLGIFINFLCTNKKFFKLFTIGLIFSALIGLIVFNIIPRIVDNLAIYNIFISIGTMILCFSLGLVINLFLDKKLIKSNDFLNKENILNFLIICAISFSLYEILVGNVAYLKGIVSLKLAFKELLPLSLNVLVVGFLFSLNNIKGFKKLIPYFIIIIASLLGAFLNLIFKIEINPLISAILLVISFGMMIYLIILNFLSIVIKNIKNKSIILGIVLGIIVIIISLIGG